MDDFNPREATLQYAAEAERLGVDAEGPAINAIACGLVYVGDQIHRLAVGPPAALAAGDRESAIAGMVDAFDPEGENPRLRAWLSDVLRTGGRIPERDESGAFARRVVDELIPEPTPSASKAVKVVATTPRTTILEVDGRQFQLFAGNSLIVEGLEARSAIDAVCIRAERRGESTLLRPSLVKDGDEFELSVAWLDADETLTINLDGKMEVRTNGGTGE